MLKICTCFSELDFEKLCRVYGYDTDSHVKRNGLYDYLQEDFFSFKDAFYAVWIVNGEYVSALRMEPYEDGYLLEALQTVSSERNKGYARCLLETVLHCNRIDTVYAHIYKNNRASMSVHCACGFRQYLDYAKFIDGTVSAKACTLKWVK